MRKYEGRTVGLYTKVSPGGKGSDQPEDGPPGDHEPAGISVQMDISSVVKLLRSISKR